MYQCICDHVTGGLRHLANPPLLDFKEYEDRVGDTNLHFEFPSKNLPVLQSYLG